MELAVLEGKVKQGKIEKNNKLFDGLYIQAVKMIVDKSYLFGFLGNTDIIMEDVVVSHCPFCGKKIGEY